MSCYYAVQRSPHYLAHYGVRGMKWGVRKAARLMTLDDKASQKRGQQLMIRQYAKANQKLDKLRKHSDRNFQKQEAKTNAAMGALGIGAGALGGLASYGIIKGQLAAQKALRPNSSTRLLLHPVGLYGLSGLSAIGGVGALGASAANAIRSTKAGNRRATEKYNQFKKEYNKTFNKRTKKAIKRYLNNQG